MRLAAALLLAGSLGGCTTLVGNVTGDDGGWVLGT